MYKAIANKFSKEAPSNSENVTIPVRLTCGVLDPVPWSKLMVMLHPERVPPGGFISQISLARNAAAVKAFHSSADMGWKNCR